MLENSEEKLAQMKDVEAFERRKGELDLELSKGQELDEVVEASDQLLQRIFNDEDVVKKDIDRLEESLANISIDFAGESIRLEDFKNSPDEMRRNFRIWHELQAGDWTNCHLLTRIGPLIAEKMCSIFENIKYIGLNEVRSMSDQVAEILSQFKGHIDLHALEDISDHGIDLLTRRHNDSIDLGVKSLSDEAAFYVSRNRYPVHLRSLVSISERGLKYLAQKKESDLIIGDQDVNDRLNVIRQEKKISRILRRLWKR